MDRKKYSDWRKLFNDVKAEGWEVEKTEKGHYKLTPPEGRDRDEAGNLIPSITCGTSNDHRAIKNAVASLRRAGFQGGKPRLPYGEASGSSRHTPVTVVEQQEEEDMAAKKSSATATAPRKQVKSHDLPSTSGGVIFHRKRMTIEQVEANLTVDQITAALRDWIRYNCNVELPDDTKFKLTNVLAGDKSISVPITPTSKIGLNLSFEEIEEEEE